MSKIFTGVGSRSTPSEILLMMQELSKRLVLSGWVLRSGGAVGADTAFYNGWLAAADEGGAEAVRLPEVFIPWEGFNGLYSMGSEGSRGIIRVTDPAVLEDAVAMVGRTHPAVSKLSRGALALHTRNCFQVLGAELDSPSNVVVCWCKLDKHGEPSGGTRTAIKIAESHGVRVVNLYKPNDMQKVVDCLGARV